MNKGGWNIDRGRNFDPISDLNSEMYMIIPISIIKPKLSSRHKRNRHKKRQQGQKRNTIKKLVVIYMDFSRATEHIRVEPQFLFLQLYVYTFNLPI